MSGWIKFDKDMASDARIAQAADEMLETINLTFRTGERMSNGDACRFVTHALRGALVTLWCYADEHIRDDDSLPCNATVLNSIIGIDGFCELLPAEWLTTREADGRVILPGYCQKNGLISKRKRREQGAERQRNYRQRNAGGDAGGDAPRNAHSNAGGDASRVAEDQDLDQDKRGELALSPPRNGKPSAARSKGTRIPEDFSLNVARRLFANEVGVDPEKTMAKFRDYWRGAPGAKGVKLDWDATWRNWCRSEADRNPNRKAKGGAEDGFESLN